MSFFLYNQDGGQAIARPFLDGGPAGDEPPCDMPKYHVLSSCDDATNAPSRNFVYDFDVYRFCVCDSWRQVLSHDAEGRVESGSVDDLAEAFAGGCALKIGVAGLCDDLAVGPGPAMAHQVIVQAGAGYYYTQQKLFIAGSHPVVRVRPGVPMLYHSRGWDFGWLMARTDGRVVYRRCDPYTLRFTDIESHHAIRWFAR